MSKYWPLFKISFQQEFAYPMNFIMWRVRNVIQIFLIFFLWDTVFADSSKVIFGYDRAKILTYVFGLIFIRSLVLAMRSIDLAGEISRGDLSNYLLKPVNYFKYWLTRDFSSKALNFLFSLVEVTILYFILKPPFYLQTDPLYLVLFFFSLAFAVLIFFFLVFLFSMFTFWQPEQAWGFVFLLVIFSEFLGGGMLPLDILPLYIQKVIYLLPFPYLMFMPLQIYLAKLNLQMAALAVLSAGAWVLVLLFLVNFVWRKGLAVYRAEGR